MNRLLVFASCGFRLAGSRLLGDLFQLIAAAFLLTTTFIGQAAATLADLLPQGVTAPPSPVTAGATFTVSDTVRNQGDTPSANVVLSSSIGSAAKAQTRGDGASEVLHVDSSPTEPANPINLSLNVRVFAAKRLIQITARVARRTGFRSDMFFDRNVRAQIALLPGLQLEDGSLSWSGDLKGDDVAEFTATVRAVRDVQGAIEATVIGQASGGRIDAEKERFLVSVSGEQVHATLDSPMIVSPMRPSTASPAK